MKRSTKDNVVKLSVVKERRTRAMPLRSVLVAVDLTPHTDRILARLALLPLAEDAQVTLVHVVPGGLSFEEERSAEGDAKKAMASEAQHLRALLPSKVSVAALVKVGSSAKEVAACARAAKAELIVMGRGSGRAVRDTFFGSTAERVVRQSKIPVLVVRRPARAPYRRPALALDFDDAARSAVRLMLRALPAPRPRVTVVHAFHAPYQSLSYPSLEEGYAKERKALLQLESTKKLAALIAAAAGDEPSSAAQLAWRPYVRYGSARAVIEKVVETEDTDLLVLGTQGYTGLAHVFLGTVAGSVLRDVKCDVLVVPPAAHKG
jgi:nucleotide-binding universal stress UspA family protein